MVDEGLVRYVKERLGEGYKEQHIKAALTQDGRSEEEINAAFASVNRSGAKPLLLILLFLVAASVALFFLLRPGAEPPITQEPAIIERPAAEETATLAATLKAESAGKTADEVYYETVQAATRSARSQSDGVLICSVNQEITYKNYCFTELATAQREATFCTLIGSLEQRDECYLSLILDGEDQWCDRLVMEENKRLCELLKGEI